jgi:hypothetical protein
MKTKDRVFEMPKMGCYIFPNKKHILFITGSRARALAGRPGMSHWSLSRKWEHLFPKMSINKKGENNMHTVKYVPAYQTKIPAQCLNCGAEWTPQWRCEKVLSDLIVWHCEVCDSPHNANLDKTTYELREWRDEIKHDADCYMLAGGPYCDCESGAKAQLEAYMFDNYGVKATYMPNPEPLAKKLERRKLIGI